MVALMAIHPTAIVSESAVIGEGSSVGAYAIVEAGVILGKNCSIAAHAIVRSGASLGDAVTVDSFSVIGGTPQSLNFDAAISSGVSIGDGCVIREGCTISRASEEGVKTVLGDHCFLMAQSHVAHDCELGSGVVLANNVMLAGHVVVGSKTFIGGGAGIHQHCRIGDFVMVAGNASITADIPPYIMVAERNDAYGLNLVGLRRGGFSRAEIADIKLCYRDVYLGDLSIRKKAAAILEEGEAGKTNAGTHFLKFFEVGKRGFAQPEAQPNLERSQTA